MLSMQSKEMRGNTGCRFVSLIESKCQADGGDEINEIDETQKGLEECRGLVPF